MVGAGVETLLNEAWAAWLLNETWMGEEKSQ